MQVIVAGEIDLKRVLLRDKKFEMRLPNELLGALFSGKVNMSLIHNMEDHT